MMEDLYYKKICYKDSAWTDNYGFAIRLVNLMNPTTIVDLGVDYGFSSFSFAYPKKCHVYAIDWFKGDGVDWNVHENNDLDTYPVVTQKYNELNQEFGIDNITFIKSDFNKTCENWQKSIDILHIDGLHEYNYVKNDFDKWSKFCKDDSVILFHDTVSFPNDAGKFFNELGDYKFNITVGYGLGIFTKSNELFNKILTII
jgi:hypothetical protein